MKKRTYFFAALPACLLFGSLLMPSTPKEFKAAKAEGEDITLHFTDFYGNGNRNVMDLRNVNENNIAVGWDVEAITQVSADAFTINGNQTIGDGYVKIQKVANFKYELCIDAINWGAYNYTEGGHEGAKCIKEGDVVSVGGSWSTSAGKTVAVSPFTVKWTSGAWEVVAGSSESVSTTFYKLEQNNQNGFYILTKTANNAPVISWETRFMQQDENGVLFNGDPTINISGSSKGRLTKVNPNRYYFGLNDINYSSLDSNRQVGDEVVLQGTWRYNISLSDYIDIVVDPLKVQWNGSAWINVPFTSVDLDLTYKTGNSKEIDFYSSSEDAIPFNSDWSERLVQSSDECITINGVAKNGCPLIKVLATTYIFYLGDIPGFTQAAIGDVVVIKGLWQYTLGLNVDIREVSLTFDGQGWLKSFVYNALDELVSYKESIDMNLYSSTNKEAINDIFATTEESIRSAENQAAAEAAVASARTSVENIKTLAEELAEAKVAAKAELESYKDMSLYRSEEQSTLTDIINNGKAAIDRAETIDEVNDVLAGHKELMDAVKTNAQRTAEELAAYKAEVLADIDARVGQLLPLYRAAEQEQIRGAVAQGKQAIDAASDIAGVDAVVDYLEEQLATLKTAAQYDAEELAAAKTAAKAELEETFASYNQSKYTEAGVEELEAAKADGLSAIDNASSIEAVNAALASAKEALAAVKVKKSGCGGSILATSAIITLIATAGAALVFARKKED